MVPVKWSKEALANLKEIKQYIACGSVYYAQRMISYITESSKLRQKHPEAGRPLMVQKGLLLRRMNVKSYMLIYTHHKDQVFIVAVVHQAKQSPTSFDINELSE